MWIKNILKSRLFSSIYKIAYKQRTVVLVKKFPECEVQTLTITSKYICLAFLNLVCIAKAEDMLKDKKNEKSKVLTLESAIGQSDELFSVGKFQDSINILEYFMDSDNVEVLWRISRALYNMSKEKGIKSSENSALIIKAYEIIEKALKIDENHFAVHKWMAILYDAKSSLEGIKARINALPVFKHHLMEAIKLNPKDATSVYMLGQYMYSLADMSWVQKTIAKTLFGTPPEATFEEAFYYFSKAEEIEPNFYSANLLMLGKTCLKLKRIEAGCYWLKCATSYPVRTDEDEAVGVWRTQSTKSDFAQNVRKVRLEAEELLKKYPGIKSPSKEEQTVEVKKHEDLKCSSI